MAKRITLDTAFDHIRGLIARNDLITAGKLLEKYGGGLTEAERRELEMLLSKRRRKLRRAGLRAGAERGGQRFLLRGDQWLWLALLFAVFGYFCLLPLAGKAVRRIARLEGPFRLLRLVPLFGYAYLPAAAFFTWRYLKAIYRWTAGKLRSELAEVAEIRSETAFFRSRYRPDVKHYYQVFYAVLRPVEPAPWSLTERRIRIYAQDGYGFHPPWPEREPPFLHTGDRVTLYYDRYGSGCSLIRYTRKRLTLEWLKLLGWLAGVLGLACLAIPLAALAWTWVEGLRLFF